MKKQINWKQFLFNTNLIIGSVSPCAPNLTPTLPTPQEKKRKEKLPEYITVYRVCVWVRA